MAKRNKKQNKSSRLLKVEALEQRQLLAGGFTDAQGQQFSDIQHPNGNVYDQVLLKTSTINVTNDPGQITRISFLDLQGDIVQVEFGGAGTLNLSLDSSTFVSGVAPTNYNQDGVLYVQGLATVTISGSDATSNVNVFSVGSANAVNTALFDSTHTGGNNTAEIQRIAIVADPANPNGSTFGSIFAGNVNFTGSSGPVGISAANVQVQGVVRVGDFSATDAGVPTLIFGQFSQFGSITVAGGDLASPNGATINNTNSYDFNLNYTDGSTSAGTIVPANIPMSLNFTEDNPLADINQTFNLTTGVDTITGGPGHDTFVGTLNDTAGTGTLTSLDTLDGAGGNNTLSINDLDAAGSAMPAGLDVSNIGTIALRAVGPANFDSSTFDNITALNLTQATSANLTAADTTAVNVSNVTGTVMVEGGSTVTTSGGTDVTIGATTGPAGAISVSGASGAVAVDGGTGVTVSTAGTTVTIGANTEPTGAISVAHTKQGANNIVIDGGTSVGVTATAAGTGAITVGGTTEPTGAVTVSSTGAAASALTADVTLGAVTIDGGSTISVTQSAGATTGASTDTSNWTVTQSKVAITGTDVTTSVTVAQDAAVTAANGVVAVAGTKETNALTFSAMTTGQTTIIGGLTFTASKNLTASEAAAAFASLAGSSVQGSAPAGNGIYSGTMNSEWSSGAASGAVVTFTAKDAGLDAETDLDIDDGTVDPTVVVTAGTNATAAVTGKMGVVGGEVDVADGGTGTDSLASVTLSGYGANSSVTSDALTSLSLANVNNIDLAVNNATATTLGLTVNNVTGGADVNIGAVYTTVNLTATGANSTTDLVAAGATTLNVSGDKSVTLTGSTLTALTKLTVSGSAGVTLGDADESDTLTSIDASGTSGAVTAQIDGTKATYVGGSGVDTLTVTTNTVSKSINLGAGNDIVTLAAGTAAVTSVDGGDGTDTISMDAADLATVTAAGTFEGTIAGFEKAKLGAIGAATTNTVNLANLDDISYIIAGGTINATGVLNVDNMASGGTLEVAAANSGTIDVDLTDATGTSDSLNVVLGANGGTLNLAGIESVSMSATANATATLVANDLTTLTLTGSKNQTLTLDAATDSLTLINGSALTGALSVTGGTSVASEIRGGSAADTLTAGHNSDVLIGNDGADTLSVGGKSLVTLTGGAGNDTFSVGTPTTNVNSYGTITDLAAGDKILFDASATTFNAAAITLADTAVFQDYANAAIASTDTGAVTWFVYGGNTYIVQNVSDGTSFVNGQDIIVKLNGSVNLATASFSSSSDTLLIV